MALIENGIYRLKGNIIIVIPYNPEVAEDILYLQFPLGFTTNEEVSRYFFKTIDRTGGNKFCKYLKCKSRSEMERLLNHNGNNGGYLGQLNTGHNTRKYNIFDNHAIYTTKDYKTVIISDALALFQNGRLSAYFLNKKHTNYADAIKDFDKNITFDDKVEITQKEFADMIDENLMNNNSSLFLV